MSLRESIATPGLTSTHHITRRTTKHQNPLVLRESASRVFKTEFYHPPRNSTSYFSSQSWPPGTDPGWWFPPPHYHIIQDEIFHVTQGVGAWKFYDGSERIVKAGGTITIPARTWHTFSKATDSEEPFAIDYRYDREYAASEERFFRNAFSYFEDCRRAGVPPNILQLAVFAVPFLMPLALPTPGWVPETVNFLLSTVVTVLLACVGWLMGYKVSYEEYYDGGVDTRKKA